MVYDDACRIASRGCSELIDEVKQIRDAATFADGGLCATGEEPRGRGRCGRDPHARDAQARPVARARDSIGLAKGGEHGGRRRIDGARKCPDQLCARRSPCRASTSISPSKGRALGALSDDEFEAVVADARVQGLPRRYATPCARSRSNMSAQAIARESRPAAPSMILLAEAGGAQLPRCAHLCRCCRALRGL